MTEVRTTNKLPPIVQRHLPEIVELARIHGVERLKVFGSVMTDHYDPLTSDIDFLVSFKPDKPESAYQEFRRDLALQDDLRLLVKSPLDLVMSHALKDERFRQEADNTRRVIYDATSSE